MPLSPRLLRPIASRSLVDADATAYLSAVQTADGQALEPAVRNAITAFVVGCKQDGIWSAIKASCILMGARTLSGALTPLVGAAPTNNGPFVSGDWNRKTGLVGNASSKYLDSNRANNADPQDNQHLAVYASTVHGGVNLAGVYAGAGGGSTGATNIVRTNVASVNSSHAGRCRTSASSGLVGSSTPPPGLFGVSRAASASYVLRTGGSNTTITEASQTPSSGDVLIFARENGSGSAEFFADARLAFYSIGESLDLALLDTRVSTLYTAIGAAIP
jgi:hypothetical protein